MIVAIQFLRFFAAAMVVLTHCRGELGGLSTFGSFGVDIFFVISGFIMSIISVKGISHFFLKRVIRIAPLYWLFTLGIILVAVISPHLLRGASLDSKHIVASFLFFPYWLPETNFSPILKLGWTLNYEMFFYLLFWVALNISLRFRELICSVFIVIIVLAGKIFSPDADSFMAFYSDTTLLEFCFGMLVGYIYTRKIDFFKNSNSYVATLISTAAFTAIYYATVNKGISIEFERWTYFGVPAMLILVSFLQWEKYAQCLLPSPIKMILERLGDASYSMYLAHIYIIAVFSRVFDFKSAGITVFYILIMLLTLFVSYLSFNFVETPARKKLTQLFINKPKIKAKTKSESRLKNDMIVKTQR